LIASPILDKNSLASLISFWSIFDGFRISVSIYQKFIAFEIEVQSVIAYIRSLSFGFKFDFATAD